MPDPTVVLWTRVKELEEEQQLHDISIDAATARAEKAEREAKRLRREVRRFELQDEIQRLEHTPCGCSAAFSDGREPVFHRCDSCKRLDEVKQELKEAGDA